MFHSYVSLPECIGHGRKLLILHFSWENMAILIDVIQCTKESTSGELVSEPRKLQPLNA